MTRRVPGDTLVVTDLDGTLWGNSLTCHVSTIAALNTLRNWKIPVLVATGRRASSARAGLRQNGLTYPAVLLNGAIGIDYPLDGHVFHRHLFDTDTAQVVLDELAAVGLAPSIYTADGLVAISDGATTSQRHLDTIGDDRIEIPPRTVPSNGVLGFSMLGMERDVLVPAANRLAALAAGAASFYQDHLYGAWSMMIQPPNVSKWLGIRAYLDHSGLRPKRIIAIGDAGNDLEMLEAADVAVSIEGGDPDALALADEILPHPDDGGWAGILDLL